MMNKKLMISLVLGLSSVGLTGPAPAAVDAAALFGSKCGTCHAIDKKKMGPALKDMVTDPKALRETIVNGRKMMPKYAGKLSDEEIDAMVDYIKAQQ
jgi:mono/diheme cytochrome c family protein